MYTVLTRWDHKRCWCDLFIIIFRCTNGYKEIKLIGGKGLVDNHIDHLIELVATNKIVLDDIVTHKVPLKEASKMYDIFNIKEDNCVKVILQPWI